MGGARCFVTFIADFSRKVWLYVLKFKKNCFEKFMEFKALVETQSEHKIKTFWPDNARNFVFKAFNQFFKGSWYREPNVYFVYTSIKSRSRAYKSYHYGDGEEHVECLKARQTILVEAVVNAIYIRIRCPTKTLDFITPGEAWSGMRPCIAYMHVFVCVTYAMVTDAQNSKLNVKVIKCLFVDYYKKTEAYRLMCLQTKKS